MARRFRTAARVAVGLGVVGGTVVMAAAPALAASGSLSVSPSGTITSAGDIAVVGHYDNSSSLSSTALKLSVDRPDGATYTLWTGSAGALSKGSTPTQHLDTSSPPWSPSVAAVNGTYVVDFSVGSTSAPAVTLTLRVPAAPVSGFGGTASGTVAHFSWSANSEPDLAGYDIVDITGSTRRDLTPGGLDTSVCSSGSCSVDIDFGSGAAGTSRTFAIDALRYTSPAHSATIPSADSAPATVTFASPSTPSPDGNGGSGGGGSGGTTSGAGGGSGGTTTGSTGGAAGAAGHGSGKTGSTISSSHASAALRAYLPAGIAGAAPDLPAVVTEVKPLPQGTYKPTLAYPDQVVSQAVHQRAHGPIAAVGTDFAKVLDVGALWKSLAGAAVVLLVAGHLRAWLAAVELADR